MTGRCWLALVVVLASGNATAQEPPPLTLGWALAEARAQNPEVRALAADESASWERVSQARALEDPTLTLQLWNFPFDKRPGAGSMIMYQIAQPLPFPGKRALRGEVAATTARLTGENARALELTLVAEVTRLYYQLWENRAAREINRRNRDLVGQLRKAALARVSTSGGGTGDVLRAETEQARLAVDLVSLGRDRRALAAALNVRLGRAADAPLGEPVAWFPTPAAHDYARLREEALRQRPDLRAAALEVERGERQVALARRSRWPDFMPSFMIMQDLEMGVSFGAMLGVTIPVWSGQKQAPAIREASALVQAARERQRTALLAIERDLTAALAAYESAAARVQLLHDEVVPKARTTLDVIVAGYVTGRESLITVLDARRVLQDLELDYERSRAEAEQARGELWRAAGGTLPGGR